MSEKLVPSTLEEYYEHTTKVIPLPSGSNFKIQIMGADATVYFYGLVPEEGLAGDEKTILKFLMDNFIGLRDNIIAPSIVAPDIPAARISFADQAVLLVEILKISGILPDEEEQKVSPPEAEDSPAT